MLSQMTSSTETFFFFQIILNLNPLQRAENRWAKPQTVIEEAFDFF